MPMLLSKYINKFTPDDKLRLTNRTERCMKARPFIFDFDYPVYDNPDYMSKEKLKEEIEINILRHYYKRQIGGSGGTIADFKYDLEDHLNLVMPYYNELFYSLSHEFDILDNTNIKETYTRKVNDTLDEGVKGNEKSKSTKDNTYNENELDKSNNNTNYKGQGNSVDLGTPQGMLNVDDIKFKHASFSTHNKDSNETNVNGELSKDTKGSSKDDINVNIDTTRDKNQQKEKIETYEKTRKGKIGIGSYPKLLADYRKNILNVINEIVESCDICFYQLYD